MYNTMNYYYKYKLIPRSSFNKINTLILPINTGKKVPNIFHTFYLYLGLPAIMNLIFRTIRLENFMTSCRAKPYQHAISIKSSSIFWSSHMTKFPSANLRLCLTRNQKSREWQTSKNLACNHKLLNRKNPKVPVTYDRNSVSDLAGSNDVATNGVNGRIGNKTWCKCEWYVPMETSIESVCCLEIPEICKPRFSTTSCLNVCRSDLYFVIRIFWSDPYFLGDDC